MAEIRLRATPRDPKGGTRAARRLRAEGKVPGVVYGLGSEPLPLTVEWRELRASLVTEQGLNAVIHLDLDGASMPTLVKDMQRHPVRRNVLHVDFLRVDLDKPVEVEVPIQMVGEAELVNRENGVVDQVLVALLVSAKPNDIPSELTVDISGLEIGHTLRVADIELPPGVTTPIDPEEAVVSGQHGVTEADLAPAGEEGEAGEAGEGAAEAAPAAEAGGGDEPAAEGGDEAAGGDEG